MCTRNQELCIHTITCLGGVRSETEIGGEKNQFRDHRIFTKFLNSWSIWGHAQVPKHMSSLVLGLLFGLRGGSSD